MNSCHLAQCEMMGHSRATRRAGAEFTITHAKLPFFSPHLLWLFSSLSLDSSCLDLLNMDGGGERWEERREGTTMQGGKRTFPSLRLLLSPVSHLKRCGKGINGIHEHGEIAAGTMCLCIYVCAAGEVYDYRACTLMMVS